VPQTFLSAVSQAFQPAGFRNRTVSRLKVGLRQAWLAAVSHDPLLPKPLLPADYVKEQK